MIVAKALNKVKDAANISIKKLFRPFDGAVHMRFGSKIYHDIKFVF